MTGHSPAERYLAQKLASRGNCYVYVLELENQRFSVGHTECLSQRLHDHWRGKGSAWTKKYPPIRVLDIIKTTLENALGLEEAKTMELKLKYGFNSARGGVDNNPNDHIPPRWCLEQPEVDRPSSPESDDAEVTYYSYKHAHMCSTAHSSN